MKKELCATVSYIAATVAGLKVGKTLRNCTTGKFSYLVGGVKDGNVHVYDLDHNTLIAGTVACFYDFASRAQITLTIDGGHFSGYDFASGYAYHGKINGDVIELMDSETHTKYFFEV